jgi:hypothetical protein
MTNSFETGIILKEESLKYVLEYTCVGRLMSFRTAPGKKSERELEWLEKM